MHTRLLGFVSIALCLFLAMPEGYGQKKSKKTPATSNNLTDKRHSTTKAPDTISKGIDMRDPGPPPPPVPQEGSLSPELQKTPKVVIVPAPPPPPGPDPKPPYPKR